MTSNPERIAADWRQLNLQRQLGQVECIGGHEAWWLSDSGCPWCKAVV